MIKAYASRLGSLLVQLHDYEWQFEVAEKANPEHVVGSEFIERIGQHLGGFASYSRLVELDDSVRLVPMFRHNVTSETRVGDARHYVREFRGAIERELSLREFFFVRPKFAPYYNEPLKQWGVSRG